MHVLPCRYDFNIKKDVGPKVCIVVKGFRRLHGLDYTETFAPVVSDDTFRVFLGIVVHFDLDCDQMDISTAFLNGDLDEGMYIYLEVPDVFRHSSRPNLVCKILNPLYGLKQAPRQW